MKCFKRGASIWTITLCLDLNISVVITKSFSSKHHQT